jgi:hypothetical protein
VGLKDAYKEMAAKRGGLDEMARDLGMSRSSLDSRIHYKKGQAVSVEDSLTMQTLSDTTLFAEAIAELSGGTFVKLPDAEDCNEELSGKFIELTIELGQLSEAYREAAKDGEITKKEKLQIIKIKNDILRTTQTLTALMFRVHCKEES